NGVNKIVVCNNLPAFRRNNKNVKTIFNRNRFYWWRNKQTKMSNFINLNIFESYQKYIDNEQEIREQIRVVVREIEHLAKEATIQLQIIHCDLTKIDYACTQARRHISLCAESYKKLAEIIPTGQYYRYSDHWTYITQRLVFLSAMVVYLEAGFLVTRETVADMLGLKTHHAEGFHLDIEDYLMGVSYRWHLNYHVSLQIPLQWAIMIVHYKYHGLWLILIPAIVC
ncbi:hypothetical protein DOY81_014871, partial [Sarcophaga bullata]